MKTETITPKRKHKQWTISAVTYIRESYPAKSKVELAREFGVSVECINYILRKHGISAHVTRGAQWRTMERSFIAQSKIMKALRMIKYLTEGKKTVNEFSEMFDCTTRTVYRYLTLIDQLNIGLRQCEDGRFTIEGYSFLQPTTTTN